VDPRGHGAGGDAEGTRRRARVPDAGPYEAIEVSRLVDELASGSIAERRLQVEVGAAFALLTLALATCGLVASLLRLVDERRHELAIRAALGGSPRQLRAWSSASARDWPPPAC